LADAIKALEHRRREADVDDDLILALELKHLLCLAGREAEAVRVLDEMIARMPDDVRFPIAKASLYLYWMDDPELGKALEAIDVALVRAHRTGYFRREALGEKARIVLKLGLGDELSRILEEIMSLEMKPGIPDVPMRERDFVDAAPFGMIADDVLARYNSYCPKRNCE
jgi:hypothetical protein